MTLSYRLGDRLAATAGRPSGFDYMRVVLALSIIVWHSVLICYGPDEDTMSRRILAPVAILVVPMFFSVSGFLVAGSMERSRTLGMFLGLRVLRIVPALAAEVVVSAAIIGPRMTSLPWRDYFSSTQTWAYTLNVVGDIHYVLPGVFGTHPVHEVNGQLWTVPYEELCYAILALMAAAGLRRREWLLAAAIAYHLAQVANTLWRPSTGYQGAGGSTVVMAFMAGVLLFRYRDRVPWSLALFSVSAALAVALPLLTLKGIRFAPLPIAYATIYLGLLDPPRNRLVLSGDYSYGLYVFGFPVQQMVWSAGPWFREWWSSLLLAIPAATALAVISWWLVERPALQQRRWLHHVEGIYLRRRGRQSMRVPS